MCICVHPKSMGVESSVSIYHMNYMKDNEILIAEEWLQLADERDKYDL